MRNYLCSLLFFLLPLVSVYGQNPNILLVIVDDVGLDPMPNYEPGSEKAFMPNLENLMDNGLTFDNVWSNPECAPTRASILTGKYGFRTNVLNASELSQLSTNETSLHEYIQQSSGGDYSTSLVGKWHLNGEGNTNPNYPGQFGMDYFAGLLRGAVFSYSNWELTQDGATNSNTNYISTQFTDLAIDWINAQDKPWFCWLAYTASHKPFHLPPLNMHSQGPLSTEMQDIAENPLPYYLGMLESADYELGRLMQSIPEDELDNTIIIFIGDNGTDRTVIQPPYLTAQGKSSLFQGGVNVPMIISGAGVSRAGEREDALINLTDLFATIVELTGGDLPTIYDSYSFKDLLSTAGNGPRNCIYSEISASLFPSGWTARDEKYKLIRFDDDGTRFYNLDEDPYEQNNLFPGPFNSEEQAAFDKLDNYFNGDCLAYTVSTTEIEQPAPFSVFPNPSRTDLQIQFRKQRASSYQIMDLTGRIVLAGELVNGINTVNIAMLQAGVYLIEIEGEVEKVVKL